MLYGRELHKVPTLWYLEYICVGMGMYIQSHRAVVSTEKTTWKDWYNSVPRPQTTGNPAIMSFSSLWSLSLCSWGKSFESLTHVLWVPAQCALTEAALLCMGYLNIHPTREKQNVAIALTRALSTVLYLKVGKTNLLQFPILRT